ncbi:polysaccharide biosynthesis protein [Roseivirga echinicomitans]|uniref:Polysaccharide biosynthesis protein n=1 Tax=Roseivirga echinicomitans TaxID=296218 RepID=A0A150XVX8_9BACT|nr:nucleoside-diphosphate sugar epimerase/dehydratase [Roseivirga echinicomitans]KYG82873.1 polysaccharide biosynthesis protein [Roseivirga echinicomitans]
MKRSIRTLNILPRWIIVIIDLVVYLLSALVGYLLRLNFNLDSLYEYNFLRGIVIFTLAGLISSLATRSFAGIIRYTGIQDTLRVFYASLITLLIALGINTISENAIPYSIAAIAFFVSVVVLTSYRLVVKELFAFYRTIPQVSKKVIIFGAGQSGMITKELLDNDTSTNVKVVGFLEDNPRKIGNVLGGVRIYSARNDFQKVMIKNNPSELIIATTSMSLDRKNELVDQCLEFGIKISTVPNVDKWTGGEFGIDQIHEVRIEDLLGRNPISLKNKYVNQELSGKSVLVTGAAGSIGSELARQIIRYNPSKLILLDQSESGLFEIENEIRGLKSLGETLVCYVADVTNSKRVRRMFSQYRPEFVFHAAAYKHVPMMEINVPEAIECNLMGTRNLADLSVEYDVKKFVMISTDKAVNPTSVMGATKRAAEIYVQSLNNLLSEIEADRPTLFITTRFGNVLGSNGSVIPIFQRQIQRGGPITVTHPEITRYFMTISEACSLVLEAGVMGNGGEIFVFDMGKSIKIVELAKRMIQLSGLKEGKEIDIVFTGLRPGEKLYEELLNDMENTMSTHHPKIMIVKVKPLDFTKVKSHYSDLEDLVYSTPSNGDDMDMKMVKVLKSLIHEYRSRESKFSMLDR